MSKADTFNRQMVTMTGGRVGVMMPAHSMTAAEARTHAAWLVCVADVIDPDPETTFAEILDQVNNT